MGVGVRQDGAAGVSEHRAAGGRLLLLVAAGLACAVVVLASGAVGTVPVRDDNPLDRLLFDQPVVQPQEAPAEELVPVQPSEPAPEREPLLPVPLDVVLAVLAVSAALALLVRSLLQAERDEPVEPSEEDVQEHVGVDLVAVTEAARLGLQDLQRAGEGEARDAVVGCWVLLEQAAEPVSGGRLPPDAPTDVADRLVAAAPAVDRAALRRLREVYARARFGTRPTGGAEVEQAVTSLRTVLAGLEERP